MKSITVLLIIASLIVAVVVAIRVYRRYTTDITSMEKDAINKGLLAYFFTDSPLLGWLVYKKNDPKNKLK